MSFWSSEIVPVEHKQLEEVGWSGWLMGGWTYQSGARWTRWPAEASAGRSFGVGLDGHGHWPDGE